MALNRTGKDKNHPAVQIRSADGEPPGVSGMQDVPALEALYPALSANDLLVAKENVDRYLSLAWEIRDDHWLARNGRSFFESRDRGTMQEKVDSEINQP